MALCLSETASLAQYHVLPGQLDSDGIPTTSARICLDSTGTERCYAPPSENEAFGLEPKARTIAQLEGKNLILFTAIFSGGGSGWTTSLSLRAILLIG